MAAATTLRAPRAMSEDENDVVVVFREGFALLFVMDRVFVVVNEE